MPAEREHDLVNTRAAQQAQMPLEQADSVETQQSLRQLLIGSLLQTHSASGGENDGAHETPALKVARGASWSHPPAPKNEDTIDPAAPIESRAPAWPMT